MKRPGHNVRLLTGAIQGRLPGDAHWKIVLEVANRAWLGPALYSALRQADRLSEIPAPVRDYLAFLHAQNAARNHRLRAQLLEAVRSLNAAHIEPTLLKGAIHLFTANAEDLGSRMISDLDISLMPTERARAASTLHGLGYRRLGAAREFGRAQDVGVIEVHDRPGPRSAPFMCDDVRDFAERTAREGAMVFVPSATAQALHLIVHDMIKEGDYWSFRLDLRHLHDLARLARSDEGVDWNWLDSILATGAAAKALRVQARALEDLFGVALPPFLRGGRGAELRHAARLFCATRSPLASAVRLVGNLSRTAHQLRHGYAWRGGQKLREQISKRFAFEGAGSRL